MAKDSRRTTSVGVLIGPRCITVAQARSRGGGVDIQARGAIETPPGAVSGAEVLDPVRVGQAIRTLWRRAGLTSRSAAVALPSPAYSMRAIRVPSVPERERRTLVRGELEQAQALPLGAGALDMIWISPPAGAPPGTPADAYAYYVGDAAVEGIRKSLQIAGVELAALEPVSIAQVRAYLATQAQRQPVAIACPAAKHTDLFLYDGAAIRQVRRIPAGWDDLRQTLAEPGTRDMIPETGGWEPWKRDETRHGKGGVLEAGDEPFEGVELAEWLNTPAPPAADEPAPMIGTPSQDTPRGDFLAAEISRTLAFFSRENAPEAQPRSLVVLGPSEQIAGIETVLAGAVDLPVTASSPAGAMDLPPQASPAPPTDDLDAYVPAIGAALAATGAEVGVVGLDLSQQEAAVRARRQAPRVFRAGMAGSTVWLLLASFAALALMLLQARAADEKARLTDEIARLTRERAPIIRYHELSVAAHGEQQRTQVPAEAILGRVAASTTDGMALTALRVTGDGKILMEGRAAGTDNVKRFTLYLGRGDSVKLPVIEQTKREQNGQLSFRITALFRDPAPPPPPAGKE